MLFPISTITPNVSSAENVTLSNEKKSLSIIVTFSNPRIRNNCAISALAVYELACYAEEGPCKIGTIAQAQSIPVRFLENILNSLKSGGFVDSVRGKDGGYFLARDANSITVGEVIRFVQGPLGLVDCTSRVEPDCDLYDDCVFRPLWEKARNALEEVYDGTTIQDLVDKTSKGCGSINCGCGKNHKDSIKR